MINYDNITKEHTKYHNSNEPKILDHPYRILLFGCSRSGKTNGLLNLTKNKMMIITL